MAKYLSIKKKIKTAEAAVKAAAKKIEEKESYYRAVAEAKRQSDLLREMKNADREANDTLDWLVERDIELAEEKSDLVAELTATDLTQEDRGALQSRLDDVKWELADNVIQRETAEATLRENAARRSEAVEKAARLAEAKSAAEGAERRSRYEAAVAEYNEASEVAEGERDNLKYYRLMAPSLEGEEANANEGLIADTIERLAKLDQDVYLAEEKRNDLKKEMDALAAEKKAAKEQEEDAKAMALHKDALAKDEKAIKKLEQSLNRSIPKFFKYVTVECKADAEETSTFD